MKRVAGKDMEETQLYRGTGELGCDLDLVRKKDTAGI